jgi:hypothetical protein
MVAELGGGYPHLIFQGSMLPRFGHQMMESPMKALTPALILGALVLSASPNHAQTQTKISEIYQRCFAREVANHRGLNSEAAAATAKRICLERIQRRSQKR